MVRAIQIFRHNFATEVAGKTYSCYGYRYLSILTDGAFNPNANQNITIKPGRLYLKFDNDEELLFNDEFRNYNVWDRDRVSLYNLADTPVSSVLSNGYGNLYLVLHNYPLYKPMFAKRDPIWCWTGSIANGSSKAYAFGAFNVLAGVEVGLPYLPPGFGRIRVKIECSTPADGRHIMDEYHQCTTISSTQVFSANGANVHTSYDIFTNRLRLTLFNIGAVARDFYATLMWLRGQV